MPATPVRSRFPNDGSPPPFGSVAPLPMTLRVHAGAFSRASRFADAYCGRTFVQSHCNSSQTIMALEVQTPWPSSVWAIRIVTVSSAEITIQALISGVAGSSYQTLPGTVCASAFRGIQKPSTNAPWAAATVARNSRRLTPAVRRVTTLESSFWLTLDPPPSRLHEVRGQVDSLSDAVIRAATAGICHLRVDVGVRGGRPLPQQGERAHDHAGLTISALRSVEFLPGDLDRVASVRRDPFDRGDRLAHGHRRGDAAGADRPAIDKQRARTALSYAAAELGARQPNVITYHPKKGRLRVG